MLRLALVLAVVVATATHAHYPPIGADTAAFDVDDGCAESPMTDSPAYSTWLAWHDLWNGNNYREPFTLGPVQEGVTTRFGTASQAVFKSGRANITIRLDDAYGWDRRRVFKLVARLLAVMPGPLMQRLPPTTTVDLTEFTPDGISETAAFASGPNCDHWDFAAPEKPVCAFHVTIPSRFFDLAEDGTRPVPDRLFGKTLLHEFAHTLDQLASLLAWPTCANENRLACDWSDGDEWQAAIAESPCAVSAYATTNAGEDFAESVVAWFGYYAGRQGRLPPEARDALRERLGKRFGVLNKLMHGRFERDLPVE